MSAGWSTVVIVAAAAVGGYAFGQWRAEQANAAQQKEFRVKAEAQADRAVKAERRLAELERQAKGRRVEVTNAVDKSEMGSCPVPPDVGGMLDALAERAASAGVSATEVSGPGSASARLARSQAEPNMR